MKTLMLLTGFLILISSCQMKHENLSAEDVQKIVLTKERQALDQWSAGNPSGYAANFADDATYFDDIAAFTRLDGIEEINNHFASLEGQIPPHNYEIVDPKVQVFGEITILTFRYHGSMPDGQTTPPWKATTIYHLNDGNWEVVHANWSLVKE